MVYQRGKFWWYEFQYNGDRYRNSTKYPATKSNLSKAEAFEARKRTEVIDGQIGIKRVPTLKEYATKFESYIAEQRLDPDTKRYYANGLRILLESRYAKQKLDQIKEYTPAEGVGNATANCVVRTLRRLLNKAKKEGLVRDVASFKNFEDRHRDKVYAPDQFDKILVLSRQPMRDILLAIHDAGMRPEEVMRSRIEWLDWNTKTITIPCGKTDNSPRTLPLSDRLLDALVVRCADKKVRKTGWLFPARNKQSKSGHTTTIAKEWARVRKLLGLSEDYVPYCARHTFGTRIYAATGNLKLVMDAMGHGDVQTAMRYQHPAIETLRQVLNKKPATQEPNVEKDRRVM